MIYEILDEEFDFIFIFGYVEYFNQQNMKYVWDMQILIIIEWIEACRYWVDSLSLR
jgi:hypothetical protein